LSTGVASATDRINIDMVTGALIDDSNGSVAGGQTQFGAIDINLELVLSSGISASDFLII
jgi:hypothetical protein